MSGLSAARDPDADVFFTHEEALREAGLEE
jgi:hypothetical protein